MNSSNEFDLKNPWYNKPKSKKQIDAGSLVGYESGSEFVFDSRFDASKHNGLPNHINNGLRVGVSGCKLLDKTLFLKKHTDLHYQNV